MLLVYRDTGQAASPELIFVKIRRHL